jgi:predicted Zn-ribbon and HTH transcriptional regulator
MLELLVAGAVGFVLGHTENSDDGRKVKSFLWLKTQQVLGVKSKELKAAGERKKKALAPSPTQRCVSCKKMFFTEDLEMGILCPRCYDEVQEFVTE